MTDSNNQSPNKKTSGSSGAPQRQMVDRKIVAVVVKNAEEEEIEEVKKEILNGKKELSKLEGFRKQSKVEKK